MRSFQLIVFMAIILCNGVVISQESTPTQPQQAQPQQAQPIQTGSRPVWLIQKRLLGYTYKIKQGWINTNVMAPPIITQRVMIPQTVTRWIMVPQTVTRQIMIPQTVTRRIMVPQIVTERVMVPIQIQRVPKPVVTWSPSVQWRY